MAQIATVGISDGDEFVGPFASWTNVKTAYGAVGDGAADDTAALQSAFGNAGNPGTSPVVYLPAGTYRITSTLGIGSPRQGISIIGQDPATTTILWAGPANGEMLYLNGFTFSKISRITWNGSGTALAALDYGWNGAGSFGGSTYVEDSDEVFENMGYGIRGGTLGLEDSEHAILRCKFISISKAGLSTENFNALDWYVWDCTFINNYVGVTNLYGGGNFQVFGSLFENSSRADIEIGVTSYFSMRQNFSQGSNTFLLVDPIGSVSAALTLQSNTILDSVSSPLQINNVGTVLLFDNIIRGSASQAGPLVTVQDPYDTPKVPGGLVAMGNTVSQDSWYSVPNGGEVFDIGNNVVGRAAISPQAPAMPSALPNYNRRIFEVASGATDAGIQQAIDNAVAYNGQRPVVHLPSGLYPISHSIVLPSGSDVQIVGDGGGSPGPSKVQWVGASSGPVLRLPGPSRAALRDFNVFAGLQGVGIQVQNADQSNGRVFMEQMNAQSMTQYGVYVNGLDSTSVILHDGYIVSDNTGIEVSGGPAAATGQPVSAKNDMFAGLTASNVLTYNVNNHGKLMSQDVWYEGAGAQLVDLTDSGTFTLHGAHVGAQDAGHGGAQQSAPTIETTNFNGLFSLLGAQLAPRNRISVEGTASNTNVLALGILGPNDNSNFFVDSTSQQAQVAMIDSRLPGGTGSVPAPDQIVAVASPQAFITSMVAQTRAEQAAPFSVLPAGTTDARFYRVSVDGGGTGVEVDAGGPGSTTGPGFSAIQVATISNTAVVTWVTDQIADTQAVYGLTAAYGSASTLDYSTVSSHSATFQGLALGTTYHFAVKGRSLSGYVSTSPDQTFTTPSVSTPTGFITSNSPGAIRGDYTGWSGMQFTVGSSAATVSQLGRMMIAGNKGTHTLKLVTGGGVDVPGGSATISMDGGTPGAFKYASLPSALILSANTSYFLLSSEVSGGDLLYDVGGVVPTNAGTVQGAVYSDSAGNYLLSASGSLSYGPLDFIYTVSSGTPTAPTATPSDPPAPTTPDPTTPAPTPATPAPVAVTADPFGGTLLTGFTIGTLRNDYTGYVGMEVSVGPAPISVSALGRLFVDGNSSPHVVKLVQTDSGVDLDGGALTISPSIGAAGQFSYATFTNPVILAANTSYYLVSQETSGGDQWYDIGPVSVSGAAGITGPVYYNGFIWVLVPELPNQSYVPVNLLFTTVSGNIAPTPIISRAATVQQ